MKKSIRKIFLITQLFLAPLFIAGVFADPPGPPDPGGPPGPGGPPVGAPIEDGIGVLLALGIAYGGYKIYGILKKKVTPKEEEPV